MIDWLGLFWLIGVILIGVILIYWGNLIDWLGSFNWLSWRVAFCHISVSVPCPTAFSTAVELMPRSHESDFYLYYFSVSHWHWYALDPQSYRPIRSVQTLDQVRTQCQLLLNVLIMHGSRQLFNSSRARTQSFVLCTFSHFDALRAKTLFNDVWSKTHTQTFFPAYSDVVKRRLFNIIPLLKNSLTIYK